MNSSVLTPTTLTMKARKMKEEDSRRLSCGAREASGCFYAAADVVIQVSIASIDKKCGDIGVEWIKEERAVA